MHGIYLVANNVLFYQNTNRLQRRHSLKEQSLCIKDCKLFYKLRFGDFFFLAFQSWWSLPVVSFSVKLNGSFTICNIRNSVLRTQDKNRPESNVILQNTQILKTTLHVFRMWSYSNFLKSYLPAEYKRLIALPLGGSALRHTVCKQKLAFYRGSR